MTVVPAYLGVVDGVRVDVDSWEDVDRDEFDCEGVGLEALDALLSVLVVEEGDPVLVLLVVVEVADCGVVWDGAAREVVVGGTTASCQRRYFFSGEDVRERRLVMRARQGGGKEERSVRSLARKCEGQVFEQERRMDQLG